MMEQPTRSLCEGTHVCVHACPHMLAQACTHARTSMCAHTQMQWAYKPTQPTHTQTSNNTNKKPSYILNTPGIASLSQHTRKVGQYLQD